MAAFDFPKGSGKLLGQMTLSLLVGAPILLIASWNRAFYRSRIEASLRKVETEPQTPAKQHTVALGRTCLLYESAAPWSDVLPFLNHLKFREKTSIALCFALLYLHRQRLTEAIVAARCGVDNARKWIEEHPQEASELLHLHKMLTSWYLRPEQFGPEFEAIRAHADWRNRTKEVIERISALGGDKVRDYRDAHLALLMLRWYQAQIEGWAVTHSLKSTDKDLHPLMPIRAVFDYDLAERMDMSDEEFDRFWASAEKW